MKTKISLVVLILCTYSIGFAQVEQTAKELAESEHQRFANELPGALANGRISIFGKVQERKQFFLEDDQNTYTEFLGWDKKKYNNSTLNNVFIALSEKTKSNKKNPNPVTVTIDFPAQPAETVVSLRIDTKGTTANYTVTTKANVTVEAQKKGVRASIAKNNVALSWEGKLPLVNGEINKLKKTTPPVLRFVKNKENTKVNAIPAKPAVHPPPPSPRGSPLGGLIISPPGGCVEPLLVIFMVPSWFILTT